MQHLVTLQTDIRLDVRILHGYLFEIAEDERAGDIQPTETGADHYLDNDGVAVRVKLVSQTTLEFCYNADCCDVEEAQDIVNVYINLFKADRK
jgi:hypothetical protein